MKRQIEPAAGKSILFIEVLMAIGQEFPTWTSCLRESYASHAMDTMNCCQSRSLQDRRVLTANTHETKFSECIVRCSYKCIISPQMVLTSGNCHGSDEKLTPLMRAIVALPFCLCILLTACAIPMKVSLRVKPVTGEDLMAEPDTSAIHPGVTTRAEILHQFAAFDAGWIGERLFLGRWLRSGLTEDMGTDWRRWEGKNLVVEFDEKDTVIRYEVLSDKQFLDNKDSGLLTSKRNSSEFRQAASTEKCPEKAWFGNRQPVCGATIKIVNVNGKDWLDISGAYLGDYRIAAEQIKGLSPHLYNTELRNDRKFPPVTSDFVLSIHLKERVRTEGSTGTGGRNGGIKVLMLDTDPPSAVLLIRFLHTSSVRQK
jgi:hypothetical protein